MKSEHKLGWDEEDAFTGWRHVNHWRPGERKKIKRRSHKIDRHNIKNKMHAAL